MSLLDTTSQMNRDESMSALVRSDVSHYSLAKYIPGKSASISNMICLPVDTISSLHQSSTSTLKFPRSIAGRQLMPSKSAGMFDPLANLNQHELSLEEKILEGHFKPQD